MKVAAFFDMDRTLVQCNSGTEWIRFLRRRRELSVPGTLRAMGWIARYKLALLDMERVTEKVVRDMAGDSEHEMIAKCEVFVGERVRSEITEAARAAVEHHRAAGHVIAILSSSTQYVTTRVAQDFGIEHVLCTRLVATDGVFTGEYERPACYGAGKITWAERFAREHGVDLAQSYFYTDSYTDLPMLERVGNRRVVNPDMRLGREAKRRNWKVERWQR